MLNIKTTRWMIVIIGILLPYLARIPGVFTDGMDWLYSFADIGIDGFLFFGAFNAMCWGTVLAMTYGMKHARTTLFPVLMGFAIPFLGYATLDLAADAQAAIVLIFIPVMGIPGALLGGALGRAFEKKKKNKAA